MHWWIWLVLDTSTPRTSQSDPRAEIFCPRTVFMFRFLFLPEEETSRREEEEWEEEPQEEEVWEPDEEVEGRWLEVRW